MSVPKMIEGDSLFNALVMLVVLSFLVERALAIVVEHRRFIERMDGKGYKEALAFILSFAVVNTVDFDILTVLFPEKGMSKWGILLTAAIISGGSKASIKLFHDVLNIKSTALKEKEDAKAKPISGN